MFCKSCLEAAKRATTITDACPICRCEEFVTIPHKQADQAIGSLHVFCTNKEKGCEWQGEVNDIINHLGNCQFEEATCSNDCRKTTHMFNDTRASSQVEAVNSKEELITQKGKVLATTEQHLNGAVNTIDQLIQRLDRGLTTKQGSIEQKAVTKDDLLIKLQQTEKNLTITKQELAAAKDSLSLAIQNLIAVQEEERKTEDNLIKQLPVIKQAAKMRNDELTQKFTNTERDLHITKQQLATTCQNLTKAEKEHVTLATNTDETLAKLETKFQTKIAEIETAAQKRITELETKLEQKAQQIEQFMSDPRIFWYNFINYNVLKLSSGDQVVPVVVKMSDYTKKKRNFINWYSESFYTHPKGYKMCLYVYPPGSDTGTHLLVYLFLMKGPYDDQLRWPLKGHCEVKLLNQISNSEHHIGNGTYQDGGHKRVTRRERSYHAMWYTHQFISYKYLHKITNTRQYLKDDSIFLQVDYTPML